MFALLAQRVALRTSATRATAVLRSRAWPVAVSSQRAWARTFVATPSLAFPPRATKSDEPATKKKTTAKKAATSDKPKKKPAARAVAAKKATRVRTKKADAKPKKPKLPVVPADQLPPKKPMPAYVQFFMKYRQTHTLPPGRESVTTGGREAGQAWKALAPAEKQVFVDEYRAAMEDWQKRRQEYYEHVDPSIISALNKRRKARGKKKIPSVAQITGMKKPTGPFLRFFAECRKDMALGAGSAQEEMKNAAVECGQRWRALSDKEKAPFFEAYRVEREQYDARTAASAHA